MKPQNHIGFSMIWLLIFCIALNTKFSLLAIFFFSIGTILPDFDLLDYILLIFLRKITFNSKVIKNISNKKYEHIRKTILCILINILGLIISICTKELLIFIIFTYISFFVFIKHRAFTHSITSLTIIILMINVLVPEKYLSYVSLLPLGYLLHLIQDMCTNNGVPLFSPIKKRFLIIKNNQAKHNRYKEVNMRILMISLFILGIIMITSYLIHI